MSVPSSSAVPAPAPSSPSSMLGFVALHFYCQLVLCPAHIVYGLLTGLVNPFAVTRHLCQVLGIRFLKSKHSQDLYQGDKKVVFLCNHRSWADFFVDQVTCGGASYLARYMVWLGTPVSSLYGWMTHSTWFFNRKRGLDRAQFSQFMESNWATRSGFGMIAYPEGTRNQNPEPLPLKTGVLHFAYEYKHPVQVVITTNKETAYNEKKFHYIHGTAVVTCFSKVLDPHEFATQKEFVDKCRDTFIETWALAHSDEAEAVEYEPPMGREAPGYAPPSEPFKTNLLRLAVFVLCVFIFTVTGAESTPLDQGI
ncbi:hypothetical protein BASA81_005548 [Batrachochytrium salamandrivorans]|nr:hypothetical protein BASA81_005548 [Batrachochytrium salamandrivorans]